jgi:hypothetical protein
MKIETVSYLGKSVAKDLEKTVLGMIARFLHWAEKEKFASYDWWDIWGTSYGGWAKTMYLKNKYLGVFFIAPLVFLDFIYPSFRKFFVKKRTFPICNAHIAMGYLNLYEVTEENQYLEKAESLVDDLLLMASPHATGLAWGMKHQWMTVQGLIPADTPCNTQTAYPYTLFTQLYAATHNEKYLEYLHQILKHVANDFPEWWEGDKLVCSYSTADKRRVVNANSYRMYMLVDGGKRFNNQIYLDKGLATLRYVLSMQDIDGSWPYSEDQNFVDCYHTVFVIKNLSKVREILGYDYEGLDSAVKKGLSYYFEKLYDAEGFPKPFAIQPRITLFKYDSYDFAESIGLLTEIKTDTSLLQQLLQFVKNNFQTKAGWFLFRIYHLLPIKGIPYMRYTNSNMFLSLTKALKYYSQNDNKN